MGRTTPFALLLSTVAIAGTQVLDTTAEPDDPNPTATGPAASPGPFVPVATVVAELSEDTMRTVQVGDTFSLPGVRASVGWLGPDRAVVAVDRASVPPRVVNHNGVVTFELQSLNVDGSVSMAHFSLVEDPTDPDQWLDARHTSEVARLLTAIDPEAARTVSLRTQLEDVGFVWLPVETVTDQIGVNAAPPAPRDETDVAADASGATGEWTELIRRLGPPPWPGADRELPPNPTDLVACGSGLPPRFCR